MPGLSLREAAREAGVSKSTILRAIQRGRLSAARTDDGGYDIQPAELFRIYEPRTSADRTGNDAVGQDAPASVQEATAVLQAENEGLRNQVATLRELADEMKAQRDSWNARPKLPSSRPPQPSSCSPICARLLRSGGSGCSRQRGEPCPCKLKKIPHSPCSWRPLSPMQTW